MTSKISRIFLLGVCIMFVLAGSLFAEDKSKDKSGKKPRWEGPPVGTVIRDFELPLLAGGTFRLSDQRGKILVLEMGACT